MKIVWLEAIAIFMLISILGMGIYYISKTRIRKLQVGKDSLPEDEELRLIVNIKAWGSTFLISTFFMWVLEFISYFSKGCSLSFLLLLTVYFIIFQVMILSVWGRKLIRYGQKYSYECSKNDALQTRGNSDHRRLLVGILCAIIFTDFLLIFLKFF